MKHYYSVEKSTGILRKLRRRSSVKESNNKVDKIISGAWNYQIILTAPFKVCWETCIRKGNFEHYVIAWVPAFQNADHLQTKVFKYLELLIFNIFNINQFLTYIFFQIKCVTTMQSQSLLLPSRYLQHKRLTDTCVWCLCNYWS